MKLILYINGVPVKEQKLYPPYDRYLSFNHNWDVKEEYYKKMLNTFKEKNQDKLIGNWEIIFSASSKINVVKFSEEFIRKFKKAV